MKLIKKISLLTLLLGLNAQAMYEEIIFPSASFPEKDIAEKDIPTHDMARVISYLRTECCHTINVLEDHREDLMLLEIADAKQQKARFAILDIIKQRINFLRQNKCEEDKTLFERIWYDYIPFTKITKKDVNREWLKLYEITQDPKNVKSMLNRTFENFPWRQMYETY